MKNASSQASKIQYLLIIAGLIAFVFSVIIMVEKVLLAADPTHIAPCTINPFISCNAVMASPQAALFGFPNPILGIAGFAIVVTVGFSILAGGQFKKWFWKAMNVGHFLAIIFVYWLFYSAVYKINSLCLYCMAVWAMMIPLFTYTLRYSLKEGHFKLLGSQSLSHFFEKHTLLITIVMYLVIIVAILQRFWSSWMVMIGL